MIKDSVYLLKLIHPCLLLARMPLSLIPYAVHVTRAMQHLQWVGSVHHVVRLKASGLKEKGITVRCVKRATYVHKLSQTRIWGQMHKTRSVQRVHMPLVLKLVEVHVAFFAVTGPQGILSTRFLRTLFTIPSSLINQWYLLELALLRGKGAHKALHGITVGPAARCDNVLHAGTNGETNAIVAYIAIFHGPFASIAHTHS